MQPKSDRRSAAAPRKGLCDVGEPRDGRGRRKGVSSRGRKANQVSRGSIADARERVNEFRGAPRR